MADTKTPDLGIYEGVSLDEYLSWPYVDHSCLTAGMRSMAHLKAAMDNPREPTEAMQLGTLIHTAALEPGAVADRYVVMPPFENEIRRPDGSAYANVKATRQYKDRVAEFREANADKEIVTSEQHEIVTSVCQSLLEHKRAREWLGAEGPVEVSIVWDEPTTGVRCKGRIDKWIKGDAKIIDLKTTVDASAAETAIAKFRYHRQMAMYRDGLWLLTGTDCWPALIFVETARPWAVRAALLSPNALKLGYREYRQLLEQYAECRKSDSWPAYADPDFWYLPVWMTNE